MLTTPVSLLIAVLFAAAAYAPASDAAEVSGLYEAEVAAASKSATDRVSALRQALLHVVVKITGQRRPPQSPRLSLGLESADRLVQQFQYRSASAVNVADGAVSSEDRLWARFDQASVDAVISEAGLPRWSRIRPEMLLWIGVEDGARSILSGDDSSGLAEAVRRTAADRGLPVVFPLLDLEDQMRVSPADVWAGFDDRIRVASDRYQPGAILVARVERSGTASWTAQVSLLGEGGVARWRVDGDEAPGLLEEVVHQAGDMLASRYAGTSAESVSAHRRATVVGVSTFDDYARILGYLEQLDEVTGVDVESLDGDRVTLSLSLRSGVEALRKLIGLGVVLAETGASGAEPLEFRLLR